MLPPATWAEAAPGRRPGVRRLISWASSLSNRIGGHPPAYRPHEPGRGIPIASPEPNRWPVTPRSVNRAIRRPAPPGVHQQGGFLWTLLVEAAHSLARWDSGPPVSSTPRRRRQVGSRKAIIALARKFLIVAWCMQNSMASGCPVTGGGIAPARATAAGVLRSSNRWVTARGTPCSEALQDMVPVEGVEHVRQGDNSHLSGIATKITQTYVRQGDA